MGPSASYSAPWYGSVENRMGSGSFEPPRSREGSADAGAPERTVLRPLRNKSRTPAAEDSARSPSLRGVVGGGAFPISKAKAQMA